MYLIRFWPVLIILLSWFVFAYPYFLQNKAPYPASYQNSFFSPWSDYSELTSSVKNNAISDVITQIYPWKHFTIEELKKGNIPWWNPFSFSGTPHLADFQTAVFSPFNLLFFILPFIDAWSLLILLQPILAGLFMYLFLKELKISKEGSLLGGLAFMFCGFNVVWMPYGTLSMAITFLPLALYAVERISFKFDLFTSLILSLSIAFSFFSGHIQTSLYFALYVFAYIIFKFFNSGNRKFLVNILIFYFIGIAISLIQIFPTWELFNNSLRSGLFSNEGAIPFSYLITVIAPDFFGNPVTRNDWVGKYAEWAGFIGIVPLLLACISVLGKKEKSKIMFFLFAGITAIILAINSPLQSILTGLKLPILSSSIPSRIIVLFSFSFSVLAAFGLDKLANFQDKKFYKKIVYICLILIGLVVIIWLSLIIFKTIPQDKIMTAVRNFALPSFLLVLVSGLIFLQMNIKRIFLNRIIIFLAILITLINSLSFAIKWVPFDPKSSVFPDIPVIKAMQEKAGDGRVYGKFGAYIDTYYRLPSVEGYDPLYNRRYGEFISSAGTGTLTPAVRSVAVLDKRSNNAQKVLDLLRVSVLFHVIGDTNKDWAYPTWKKDKNGKYLYSVIFSDDKFQLLKNSTALPRAKLFYDYEIIKEDKDIIKRFYSDSFDFRNKLILEENPGIKQYRNKTFVNKAAVTSYSPNKVLINVNTDRPALLFLSDSYYPGWKAKVNGTKTKIYRSDYAFRAVEIPKGKSSVEFYYDPMGFI